MVYARVRLARQRRLAGSFPGPDSDVATSGANGPAGLRLTARRTKCTIRIEIRYPNSEGMKKMRRATAAAFGLAAILSVAGTSSAQSKIAEIPDDSPLLHIDPKLVECGRPLIALMDATRKSTGW